MAPECRTSPSRPTEGPSLPRPPTTRSGSGRWPPALSPPFRATRPGSSPWTSPPMAAPSPRGPTTSGCGTSPRAALPPSPRGAADGWPSHPMAGRWLPDSSATRGLRSGTWPGEAPSPWPGDTSAGRPVPWPWPRMGRPWPRAWASTGSSSGTWRQRPVPPSSRATRAGSMPWSSRPMGPPWPPPRRTGRSSCGTWPRAPRSPLSKRRTAPGSAPWPSRRTVARSPPGMPGAGSSSGTWRRGSAPPPTRGTLSRGSPPWPFPRMGRPWPRGRPVWTCGICPRTRASSPRGSKTRSTPSPSLPMERHSPLRGGTSRRSPYGKCLPGRTGPPCRSSTRPTPIPRPSPPTGRSSSRGPW